jgi:FPC/CPF motif-containing protein YcgG
LERYDNAEHFPDFGMVDEGIPLAWKAYFISDENTPITTECPFTFRGAHTIELHDEDTA